MAVKIFEVGIEVNGSIKKVGGLASQFLKADGTVDTNVYLTALDTALQILTKLLTVDGAGSGLDADYLDGLHKGNGLNTIPFIDSSGKLEIISNSDINYPRITLSNGHAAGRIHLGFSTGSSTFSIELFGNQTMINNSGEIAFSNNGGVNKALNILNNKVYINQAQVFKSTIQNASIVNNAVTIDFIANGNNFQDLGDITATLTITLANIVIGTSVEVLLKSVGATVRLPTGTLIYLGDVANDSFRTIQKLNYSGRYNKITFKAMAVNVIWVTTESSTL